ncbi:MAG TPA: hypothetical protein VI112_05335, partial [Bacteroidia bacterium]
MSFQKICPYPGLRPFNEDESIYFKGREEHIDKIITLLQEKKFLMVTGASGDGKSSLIYAGLIPRSRAGFFKANFNNWRIADLRPERSPLGNLARAITQQLELPDEKKVEDELSYGFSSLAKIYRESKFYMDITSAEYQRAGAEEKQERKNKCANLLILVDQFEELFTNAENFSKGRPSLQAITLINLIIETTRIAEKEGLPIYIVCTMRSDYVGDCAAFKGLPELIVRSQFFVPRLKRMEIHRAISEPAALTGNKISNRLVEKLINDSGDGQDQLPILQHALNRIWKAHMDEGAEEMDLLHYAKVGGMDSISLPDEQKKKFSAWYVNLPLSKQKILESASLSNVLNAHARDLFDSSVGYFGKHTGRDISREEAHGLLKKIFTCLTKINDNRAVRNRCTVSEVRNTLGNSISIKQLEGLVNIYREPANTLLKPFIDNNGRFTQLTDDDILDITHESLIRNWTDLTAWTKSDHENVLVMADFKKQLDRWESQSRSSDHLLTIGSLSYFKNWYSHIDPNPYLVARYDQGNLSPKQKVEAAGKFITSAEQYLQASDKAIKRRRKTAMGVISLIVAILISFTSWAFIERNKALEQQKIADQKTKEALASEKTARDAEQDALRAKDTAEVLKNDAQISEKNARTAQHFAEQSKQEALHAKEIAEKEKRNAEEQTKVAEKEKLNAEKQKEIANAEKKNAEESEKNARSAYLLALAQSIALKSNLYKDDPQLESLLALQAYYIFRDNSNTDQDPVVYDALRNASANINSKEHLPVSCVNEPRALIEARDTLFYADRFKSVGALKKHKVLAEHTDLNLNIGGNNSPIDIVAFSGDGKKLITGHNNYHISLWDIDRKQWNLKTPQVLKGHRGLVRGICFLPDNTHFVTGGKDSTLIFWKIEDGKAAMEKNLKLNSGVKGLAY